MKKLLVTFMVALFATVVLGQDNAQVKNSNYPKTGVEVNKIPLKTADLPNCVKKYIMQNFKGFNIDRAYQMGEKGEILYLVSVLKGKERMDLQFDKMCNKVQKVATTEPKKEAVPPPPPKPVPLPPVKAKNNQDQTAPAAAPKK